MDSNRIYKRFFHSKHCLGSILSKVVCLHFRTIRIPFEEESSGLEEKVL